MCKEKDKKYTRDPLLGKRYSAPEGPAYIPFTQILRTIQGRQSPRSFSSTAVLSPMDRA